MVMTTIPPNSVRSTAGSLRRRDVLGLMAASPLVLPSFSRALAQGAVSGSLSLGITNSQEPQMRTVVAAYNELRPDVEVEFNVLAGGSDQLRQNLITRQMASRLPDIVNTYDRFPRQFADAGLTTDLAPYLTSGGPVSEDLFAPTFIGQYRVEGGDHDGEVHGMPVGADAVVLYFNKGHFDEAGIAYPDETWTWDTLVETARALTVSDGGNTTRYGFATRYHWHATYVPMIKAFGGSFLGEDGLVDLATDAGAKTFHLLLDHVQEGIFATPAAIRSAGDEAVGFGNELYSMMAFVRSGVPRIRAAMRPEMDFDVVQQPLVNGTRAIGMGSVGLAITPQGAENTDVVYDFLDFFYAEDGGMAVLASTYAVVPPVSTLFDSPIWRDLPPPPHNNQAFVDAMEHGVPNPAGIPADSQGVIDAAMVAVVEGVLIGGQTVEDALAGAEATINAEIERARAG
jgi:ABC-type glycerol-3-phosphate transport system substrate-binding protein